MDYFTQHKQFVLKTSLFCNKKQKYMVKRNSALDLFPLNKVVKICTRVEITLLLYINAVKTNHMWN